MRRCPKPGTHWRILANERGDASADVRNAGVLDEVCLDRWLHLEQMSARQWWMGIGEAHVWITYGRRGKVEIRLTQGAINQTLVPKKNKGGFEVLVVRPVMSGPKRGKR